MCGGREKSNHFGKTPGVVAAGLAGLLLLIPTTTVAQQAASQKIFKTPEAAVDALLQAFKDADERALLDLFGHQHKDLVVMTDKVAFKQALAKLSQAAKEAKKLEEAGDDRRILVIGNLEWPLPIPLVKEKSGWRFDTDAGAEEILNRRIGRNELEAIENCRTYVAAQVEYAERDRDADEVLEYAQKARSTEGRKDGLYWEVKPDSDDELSPFGPLMADAAPYLEAAKESKTKIPYKGYFYKILTRQGPNPPGGKYDYVINGNMIAGFAMVAWPADHGSSGIMTFVVSHQGKIYQKDLGEKTAEIAAKMTEYNPDKTWTRVQED